MKKKIAILGIVLIALTAVSGCVDEGNDYIGQYYNHTLVTHNNSLREAFNKCATQCGHLEDGYIQPELVICTPSQCQCDC